MEKASSDWGMIALGFAGGIAAHELGHYVIATSKGYKVRHDGVSIVYPGAKFTDADHLQVASAGFQTQWLLAELALRNREAHGMVKTSENFGAGVICAHLGITLAYLTALKNHKQGDIAGISQVTQLPNDKIALALAFPGALDAWRLFGNDVPTWVPQLSALSKGAAIAWAWTY